MPKPRSFFVVPPLPADATFTGCTVARSKYPHPRTFVKTQDGTIYVFGAVQCDLLGNYGANDNARRTFAKLAGISPRDMRNAVKAVRAADVAEARRSRLARLQYDAKALGLRLVKARQAVRP